MGSYKKFIIKLLVFAAIFVFLDFLLGRLFRRLEEVALKSSPYSMQVDYTIKEVQSDILIIGASEAAHSYIPQILKDSLNCSVYNCGIDGQPSYYHIAVVNCILDRYAPKMILWSVSPMWLSDKNANEDQNRLSVLNRFYKDYPYCREMIRKKSKYEPIKCHLNTYTQNSNLYQYLSYIIKPDKDVQYGRYLPLYGTDKSIELQERDLSVAFSYSEELAETFTATLLRCKEKGVKVILVFTPRYEKSDYADLISYKKIQEIALESDALLLEDYYHNSIVNKPQYYKDFAHLNDEGAHLFSAMLANRLKTIY